MNSPTPDSPVPVDSGGVSGRRVLELFAGIGGLAAAWPLATIVAAVDIDQAASAVYRANFSHPCHNLELATIRPEWLRETAAEVWWMSPPCTPFTRRGKQLDLDDPRNRALLHLVGCVAEVRPRVVLLENVVGFETGRTMARIRSLWPAAGYHLQWRQLCPSQMGWPNLRPRIYLVASLDHLPDWKPLPRLDRPLDSVLAGITDWTSVPSPDRYLPELTARSYERALHRVRREDPAAVTACFTRGYGRSLTRSGSYLVEGPESAPRYRRFSPAEVAALLGFPGNWQWPGDLSDQRRWQLLGNSLALPAVRYVLDHLPPPVDCRTGRRESGIPPPIV